MSESTVVDSAGIISDGNPNAQITAQSFTKEGETMGGDVDLALVIQSAAQAKAFIANRQ